MPAAIARQAYPRRPPRGRPSVGEAVSRSDFGPSRHAAPRAYGLTPSRMAAMTSSRLVGPGGRRWRIAASSCARWAGPPGRPPKPRRGAPRARGRPRRRRHPSPGARRCADVARWGPARVRVACSARPSIGTERQRSLNHPRHVVQFGRPRDVLERSMLRRQVFSPLPVGHGRQRIAPTIRTIVAVLEQSSADFYPLTSR